VPFYPVESIESHAWLPSDCPLCTDRRPLTDPGAGSTMAS
jgi:hypothetical protein